MRNSPPPTPIKPAAAPITMPERKPSVPPFPGEGPTAWPPSWSTWSGCTAILEDSPDARYVMTAPALVCLTAVFALTAFVSVVTGGTSLITVPVMIELGIDPHVAVATNMLTLIFLSLGGRRSVKIRLQR
jgi:Sulfite exporter TauE/SafE